MRFHCGDDDDEDNGIAITITTIKQIIMVIVPPVIVHLLRLSYNYYEDGNFKP